MDRPGPKSGIVAFPNLRVAPPPPWRGPLHRPQDRHCCRGVGLPVWYTLGCALEAAVETLCFCECGRGAVHSTLGKELRRRRRPTPVYVGFVWEPGGRAERGRNLRCTFSSCDVPNADLRCLSWSSQQLGESTKQMVPSLRKPNFLVLNCSQLFFCWSHAKRAATSINLRM